MKLRSILLVAALVLVAGGLVAHCDASELNPFGLLAQSEDGGSNVRVTGRSVRGLISLVILGIAGAGWVFKKLTGGGDGE
ncbi:MAG: hypothetical protein R3C49_04445 [Planctomycetaceae bacterium]